MSKAMTVLAKRQRQHDRLQRGKPGRLERLFDYLAALPIAERSKVLGAEMDLEELYRRPKHPLMEPRRHELNVPDRVGEGFAIASAGVLNLRA